MLLFSSPISVVRGIAGSARTHIARSLVMMASQAGSNPKPKTVLITGATSGIGLQTAKILAESGHHVFVHGRSAQRCEDAVAAVRQHAPNAPTPEIFVADLSEDVEVRKLAAAVSERCGDDGLDVLLNNAGVFDKARRETRDGIEMTFAVNVLAPLLLSRLLWDDLKKSSQTRRKPSRIVNTSSIAHTTGSSTRAGGTIDWEDLESKKRYDGYGAYGLSKLLITMVTYSMADASVAESSNSKRPDVDVLCLHPGVVNTKMLQDGWGNMGIPIEDARDEAWGCTSAKVENGKFYVDQRARSSTGVTYDSKSVSRLMTVLDEYLSRRSAGSAAGAPKQ